MDGSLAMLWFCLAIAGGFGTMAVRYRFFR
jgi:hypothetical protein